MSSRKVKTYLPFAILLLYCLLLNIFILHPPFSVLPLPAVAPVKDLLILESDSPTPPSSDANWQTVQLPDDWYQSKRPNRQYWYQASTRVDSSSIKQWAIYFPHVTHNVEVYINGIWVGRAGKFSQPLARHHNKPLLFSFSGDLLQDGDTKIFLRVAASHASQGLLDQFYLAPFSQLEPFYLWKKWLRVDLIQWFTLLMYFMCVVLFLFWVARPQDKTYGLFALLLLLWATHNLNLFVADIPVSARLWEAMTMSTLGWSVVTMIFFNHAYTGIGSRAMERVIVLFAVMGLGIFLLPDIDSILHLGYGAWDLLLIFFGAYAIYHLLSVYWHTRNHDVFLILLAGIPILVCGFHDILVVNNFRDRREGLIIQYSAFPAAVIFSWFLVRRFLQSIAQAEQLAHSLESQVKDREQQIREQYERLALLENERILSSERERIMRDMHDGIGGQLLSLKSQLQDYHGEVFDRIGERVQRSLHDLRMMIDSLDPVLSDLPTLLGMMRARIEEQLESTGIELKWAVHEMTASSQMSPEKSLHLLRILQEAVTNVVKHSGATELTFFASQDQHDPKCAVIEIRDNGCGMPDEAIDEGRGLTNMRYRAHQIGGKMEFPDTGEGACARLVLKFAD